MKYTRKNIFFHELIGLKIRVIHHSDPGLVGVKGVVIDETQKTIVIETVDKRRKRILKEHGVYEIQLPTGEKVVIRGYQILGRPEDRLKNILRK